MRPNRPCGRSRPGLNRTTDFGAHAADMRVGEQRRIAAVRSVGHRRSLVGARIHHQSEHVLVVEFAGDEFIRQVIEQLGIRRRILLARKSSSGSTIPCPNRPQAHNRLTPTFANWRLSTTKLASFVRREPSNLQPFNDGSHGNTACMISPPFWPRFLAPSPSAGMRYSPLGRSATLRTP